VNSVVDMLMCTCVFECTYYHCSVNILWRQNNIIFPVSIFGLLKRKYVTTQLRHRGYKLRTSVKKTGGFQITYNCVMIQSIQSLVQSNLEFTLVSNYCNRSITAW